MALTAIAATLSSRTRITAPALLVVAVGVILVTGLRVVPTTTAFTTLPYTFNFKYKCKSWQRSYPAPPGSTRSTDSSRLSGLKAKKSSFDDSIYGVFEEGNARISRGQDNFSLYYRIYSNNSNGDKQALNANNNAKAPLVVLHGGPSLPSQYLYPMVPNLNLKNQNRPIIFYDQLGCGRSDEPRDKGLYSISQSIEDLDSLLQALGYQKDSKIHLFGHSYGGNLAYEYAKRQPLKNIQSLILANTPTNMKSAGDSYDRLALRNPLGFWKQRVCSLQDSSPALEDALHHVGHVWAGMDVVMDYAASPPLIGSIGESDARIISKFPNTLIISGRNDFCFESSCGQVWKYLLSVKVEPPGNGIGVDVDEVCFEKCAHYPHLEDGVAFGKSLDEFLTKNDDDGN